MNGIAVRSARKEDAPAIDALARATGLEVKAEQVRSLPYARLLLAEGGADGECLGFVLYQLLPDEVEVLDLAVDPGFRRQGIARQLLMEALTDGRKQGKLRAVLEVRSTNEAAQALYQSCGFQEEGVRPKYYRGGESAKIFGCCLGLPG